MTDVKNVTEADALRFVEGLRAWCDGHANFHGGYCDCFLCDENSPSRRCSIGDMFPREMKPIELYISIEEGDGGRWLGLPANRAEVQMAFSGRKATLDGLAEWEVSIGCNENWLENAINQAADHNADLDKLNYLASVLETMIKEDDRSIEILEAVLEAEPANNLDDIITAALNLDCYEYQRGVCSDYELGLLIFDNDYFGVGDENTIGNYIDYEKLGEDIRMDENGHSTSDGYIANRETVQRFDGKVPEEYKVMQ
jgi:hypothetical protein